MDAALVIRHRLSELDLDQRDLATAAQVTESYIFQLLTGKKASPAAHRTTESQQRFLFSHLLRKQYKTEFGHVGDIGIERVTILSLDRIRLTQVNYLKCHDKKK
jgi:hypothetical protein